MTLVKTPTKEFGVILTTLPQFLENTILGKWGNGIAANY